MTKHTRTSSELRRDGFRALLDHLGPGDAIRFIQQFDGGRGDYTHERHAWLDGLSLDEVLREIDAREKPRRAQRGRSRRNGRHAESRK